MKIRTNFGVVILLDALGARTTDTNVSRRYLKSISALQERELFLRRLLVSVVKRTQKTEDLEYAQDIKQRLAYRYFGDSILISYSIGQKQSPRKAISWLASLICLYICEALKRGILLRGSFAVGRYLESKTVILGPAITDAANWYEQIDMVGVIATPSTMNYLRSAWQIDSKSKAEKKEKPKPAFILYEVPLSKGDAQNLSIKTYALDWPYYAFLDCTKAEMKDCLLWYYNRVKLMHVSKGTEKKYSNTEAFVIRSKEVGDKLPLKKVEHKKPQITKVPAQPQGSATSDGGVQK